MPRMFASDPHCQGVTVGRSGRSYDNDRSGFVSVDSAADVRQLEQAGFVVAGHTPKARSFWRCDCGFDAWINHCPRCDRSDLTKHP